MKHIARCCRTLHFISVNYRVSQCSLQKLKMKGCDKAAVRLTHLRQRVLLLLIHPNSNLKTLVLFISKYCYQIYGVLKYIANISGLTALARYRSGALFLEGFDHYCTHWMVMNDPTPHHHNSCRLFHLLSHVLCYIETDR